LKISRKVCIKLTCVANLGPFLRTNRWRLFRLYAQSRKSVDSWSRKRTWR